MGKTIYRFFILALVAINGNAQIIALLNEPCLPGRSATEKRAHQFIAARRAELAQLDTQVKKYGYVLRDTTELTTLDRMKHHRYTAGSLSPHKMTAYEQYLDDMLQPTRDGVAKLQAAAIAKWRRENPTEARIQDAEKRAAAAEKRARDAEDRANWAEMDAMTITYW